MHEREQYFDGGCSRPSPIKVEQVFKYLVSIVFIIYYLDHAFVRLVTLVISGVAHVDMH